jgi:hypothetical protein
MKKTKKMMNSPLLREMGGYLTLFLALGCMACQQISGPSDNEQETAAVGTERSLVVTGGKRIILPWTGYDYAITRAKFVTDLQDGWPTEEAWKSAIANTVGDTTIPERTYVKQASGSGGLSDSELAAAAKGVFKAVWDGPVLYFRVDVADTTINTNAITPTLTYSKTANAAGKQYATGTPTNIDGVWFRFDLWDQKQQTDHPTSLFWIDREGNLAVDIVKADIPTYSGIDIWEGAPEFTNRIKDWKTVKGENGSYTVLVAFEIGATEQDNGMHVGLDVAIGDNTEAVGSTRRTLAFWSHYDNDYFSLAANFSGQDGQRSLDWGSVVLDGYEAKDFAPSTWRLRNYIRYVEQENVADAWTYELGNSPVQQLPKNVYTIKDGVRTYTYQPWTELSWTAVETALAAGKTALLSPKTKQSVVDAAADALFDAIWKLERLDGVYPGSPYSLPEQNTLPDPYKFKFGANAGSSVTDKTSWEARRAEILDLAQYYEYGYKPPAPDSISIGDITWVEGYPESYYTIPVKVTQNKQELDLNYYLTIPSMDILESLGKWYPVPVVIGIGDAYPQWNYVPMPDAAFEQAGYARLLVSPASVGDAQSNQIWFNDGRTGGYHTVAPYNRNDITYPGNEAIAAWSASVGIDALEKAVADRLTTVGTGPVDEGTPFDILIDPAKLAVTGFSINGKYAFAAGVFDERIDVTMPGAAGASGPQPYRTGFVTGTRVYSWGTSTGGETINQTTRHNRTRETDFFRYFLTPMDFYVYALSKEPDSDGNLAVGGGNRLPYDKHEVVASIWPRAIIEINTVNDYNDGAEGDPISLQAAKVVARWLGPTNKDGVVEKALGGGDAYSSGLAADDLFKFNFRSFVQYGDPHGYDTAQYARAAEYLDFYFYGTTLSTATAKRLNFDPFAEDVLVEGGSNSYERHYGGLKNFAPWGATDSSFGAKVYPEAFTGYFND